MILTRINLREETFAFSRILAKIVKVCSLENPEQAIRELKFSILIKENLHFLFLSLENVKKKRKRKKKEDYFCEKVQKG